MLQIYVEDQIRCLIVQVHYDYHTVNADIYLACMVRAALALYTQFVKKWGSTWYTLSVYVLKMWELHIISDLCDVRIWTQQYT